MGPQGMPRFCVVDGELRDMRGHRRIPYRLVPLADSSHAPYLLSYKHPSSRYLSSCRKFPPRFAFSSQLLQDALCLGSAAGQCARSWTTLPLFQPDCRIPGAVDRRRFFDNRRHPCVAFRLRTNGDGGSFGVVDMGLRHAQRTLHMFLRTKSWP